MTPRTSLTASSWLCQDRAVRSGPKSRSSVSAMDEAYTDDDEDADVDADDDYDADDDDEAV